MKLLLLLTNRLLVEPKNNDVTFEKFDTCLSFKSLYIVLFGMFSFLVSAQEPEKRSMDLIKNIKKESKELLKLNSENNLVSKNSIPDKGSSVPQEFYILNDKPVDKVTYLRSLKSDKK